MTTCFCSDPACQGNRGCKRTWGNYNNPYNQDVYKPAALTQKGPFTSAEAQAMEKLADANNRLAAAIEAFLAKQREPTC